MKNRDRAAVDNVVKTLIDQCRATSAGLAYGAGLAVGAGLLEIHHLPLLGLEFDPAVVHPVLVDPASDDPALGDGVNGDNHSGAPVANSEPPHNSCMFPNPSAAPKLGPPTPANVIVVPDQISNLVDAIHLAHAASNSSRSPSEAPGGQFSDPPMRILLRGSVSATVLKGSVVVDCPIHLLGIGDAPVCVRFAPATSRGSIEPAFVVGGRGAG
jgi:hypothetical protein